MEPLNACMSGFKAVVDTVVQRVPHSVRVNEARFDMTKARGRRHRQETVAAEEASPPQSQGEGQLTQTLAHLHSKNEEMKTRLHVQINGKTGVSCME